MKTFLDSWQLPIFFLRVCKEIPPVRNKIQITTLKRQMIFKNSYILETKLNLAKYKLCASRLIAKQGSLVDTASNAWYIITALHSFQRVERELRMRNYEITSDSHCYLIINAGFFLDNADNLEGYVLWTTEPNTQKQYNSLIASNINYGDFSLEKYACKRKTPYYAANAEFVDFLSNLKKLRELAGDHDQVTAYMRAIASIKAFPERLQNLGTLKRLPYCGEKIVFLFTLYSRGDYMSELAELRDKKTRQLKELANVFGLGPNLAKSYISKGCTCIKDLRKHFKSLNNLSKAGLNYYYDFQIPITTKEAFTFYEFLRTIIKNSGFSDTCLCGSFRRGKPFGNDLDIVITKSEPFDSHEMCVKLLHLLQQKLNMVILSTQNHNNGFGGSVVILLSILSPVTFVMRRVDLIVVPKMNYGMAILGWTGGVMFVRDLRLYSKYERNISFDSYGSFNHETNKFINLSKETKSLDAELEEKKVFDFLKLQYIPPYLRNTE